MSGWKIRKNDWYILDPREAAAGGEGVLRRETSIRRAEAWMAGLHNLTLATKEKSGQSLNEYAYTYGPGGDGATDSFQVVRGDRLRGLAYWRRELRVRAKYPYAWTGGAYRTDQFINREPLLRDSIGEIVLRAMADTLDQPEGH
jgi:hypothetical protein